MTKLNETTIVEVNELEVIAQKDFDITKFNIGHDFLVLKKELEDGNHLELSLWAYGKGMDEHNKASDLEILIGIRDQYGDIDMLEDEGFEPSEYTMDNLDTLLKEFEEKMLSEI